MVIIRPWNNKDSVVHPEDYACRVATLSWGRVVNGRVVVGQDMVGLGWVG